MKEKFSYRCARNVEVEAFSFVNCESPCLTHEEKCWLTKFEPERLNREMMLTASEVC